MKPSQLFTIEIEVPVYQFVKISVRGTSLDDAKDQAQKIIDNRELFKHVTPPNTETVIHWDDAVILDDEQ
jgi:hypothetical protein